MDDFVTTRGSSLKRNAVKDFIAVSYTAPKKKKKLSEVNPSISQEVPDSKSYKSKEVRAQESRRDQEVEMKRARFDVIKFGMSGFDGAKGEEAKVNLAIKLGAKPKKNKPKNYKDLKLEREKAKEVQKKQDQISSLGIKRSGGNTDRKRARKQPGLLSNYGVVNKTVKAAITDNKRRR